MNFLKRESGSYEAVKWDISDCIQKWNESWTKSLTGLEWRWVINDRVFIYGQTKYFKSIIFIRYQ